VTAVATVWIAILDRITRGDEIERMVAGLGLDRVFAGFGHVAFNASAANTLRRMVSMFVKSLVIRTNVFPRPMTGEA